MIYTLDSSSSYYYFLSKDVKVFPCSYRGTYDVKLNDNTTNSYTFDPEARLNTEYNYRTIPGTNGHTSYIKSYNSTDGIVCCVVGGYYFELNIKDLVGQESVADMSLYILTRSIELVNSTDTSANYDKTRSTTVLTSINSDASLDTKKTLVGKIPASDDAPTEGYVFTGIVLTKGSITGATASLQLFDSAGQINKKALLPMLYHGAGDNSLVSVSTDYNGAVASVALNEASGYGSIALGYHTATSKNHQVVVGKYNDDVEGEFVIGNGNKTDETTTKINSFVANGDTISITENLTIKDLTIDENNEVTITDYVNFTPDTTTIKTETFTIADKNDDTKVALLIDNETRGSEKVEIKNISSTQSITLDSKKAELKHSDTSKLNLTSTEATLTAVTIKANGNLEVGTTDTNKTTKLNGSLTTSGVTVITNTTPLNTNATDFSGVEAALKVAGGVHIKGKLNVVENVTMPSLTAASDKVTITSDIHLKEGGYIYNKEKTGTVNILFGSNALQATAPTIKANGNLEVGDNSEGGSKTTKLYGTLTATGATTLDSTLAVTGVTGLSTTNISGVTTISNTTEYETATNFNDIKAALKVDGGVHISKKLNVATNVTVGGTLSATGEVTFSKNTGYTYTNSTHNAALKVAGGVHIGEKLNVLNNISTAGNITLSGTDKKIQVGSDTENTTITNSSVSTASIYNCTQLVAGNSNATQKLYYDNTNSASDWKIKNANHTVTLVDKNGVTKLNKLEITGNSTDTSEKMFALYTGNQGAELKFKVDYDGNAEAAGTIVAKGEITGASFNADSDRRLKENIIPFSSEKSILDLPIYKYDYIEGTKNNIGCIAQELQEICPELVSENENGYLSVKESKLVYLLLEEIKKLNARITNLEKR